MNFEQARFNMIEQQIRTWEVLDQNILDLLVDVRREDFIPEEYKQLALADTLIPLAHGQITMTPKVEARVLQSVNIQTKDKVLEIGTGCAYLTTLMAKMAYKVTSVDIYSEFTEQAEKKLKLYNIENVKLENGDAIAGWESSSPYDVIVATGSVPLLETHYQKQLAPNGRLFIIVGNSPIMDALLITQVGNNEWATESLFETDIPSLIGAKDTKKFQL